ncbi:MAG TPA: enolase C-terminal domain-like protein [Acidimicrobiia bacterium]|nr:enolase C-terminal domain-like protein [Acidimicrobiia bacterium]
MKITAVETYPIRLPLARPVQMSNALIERSNNVLVKITTDVGLTGWGEGVEAIALTGENQGRIKAAIDELGARLLGQDPRRLTALWLEMQRGVHGNMTAIGAIDIALHDLAGKALGVPIHQLLGGPTRSTVPALTLIGSGDPDADVVTFDAKYDAGYRWFKLKLGIGDQNSEIKTMSALANHSNVVLCGDVNGGWDEYESLRFLRAIDGLGVRFVEQPTLDRQALVRVAAASPVAICADESAGSVEDLLGFGPTAVAGVSLKLIKLGGITGVMRGAALCDMLHLAINLAGKVAESSVAAAANLHCAAAMSELAFGCSPGNQAVAADVTADPVRAIEGVFTVSQGPGLGVEVDEARVAALSS